MSDGAGAGEILAACGILIIAAFICVTIVATVPPSFFVPPSCPQGYVLAGGGFGGRYHCIVGVEPVRR